MKENVVQDKRNLNLSFMMLMNCADYYSQSSKVQQNNCKLHIDNY